MPTSVSRLCMPPSGHESPSLDRLLEAIHQAARLLPAQGPITAFVHHNTLHAFEELPFEEAVVRGGETFGCHPFLPEGQYRSYLVKGRIRHEDIEAVLVDDLGDRADELLGFLGTRFHLRTAMLQYPLRTGPAAELRWAIAETDALRRFQERVPAASRDHVVRDTQRWVMRDLRNGAPRTPNNQRILQLIEVIFQRFGKGQVERWTDATWQAFSLHVLWLVCRDGLSNVPPPPRRSPVGIRHRDVLLDVTGVDSDRLIDEVLIRFCAAYLDQGLAAWSLPHRSEGLFRSFLMLYADTLPSPERWLRGLRNELKGLRQRSIEPLESIAESLQVLGIDQDEQAEFITRTLLALRGYAGMVWQLESRADRVAQAASANSLVEFLAVRLILERRALEYTARQALDYRGPLAELRTSIRQPAVSHEGVNADQRAFLVFQLAQFLGWSPQDLYRLGSEGWASLVREVEMFSGLERRRIYQLAYERRYRIQTLDAVSVHAARATSRTDESADPPSFQVICCIDEREESFRRHLEEIAPDCETLGTAGFFAIAMYYRGAADAHYTPLCPVIITPKHYVAEQVVYTFEYMERRRRRRRRTIGTVTHRVHVGSRTFAGGWLAAVLGSLASVPLVMRILFPRATAQLRRLMGGFVRPPAVTQLQLERTAPDPGPDDGHIGYGIEEMAQVVERVLRDIGLTRTFAPLIIICGHGSSSLNNPHESAHDCGACGGGRGGPNARAFAQMAGNPVVRELVARNGLLIPRNTVFLGAYHNTCDDSVTYYDLDRLPATHKSQFERARRALDEARKRSAHERCRRFESAELKMDVEQAIRHVEGRAEDLSQVRPEYGHATNAICFVGRRRWSRGLFLDRRAFLQSYDAAQDDEQRTILNRILQAVIPVCAGINLEYYFSFVDPTGYGCGTKLPHNITSLLGVMNGAASDLRPGLPWQMVEIHEPVRLLFVIETTPESMLQIMEQNPAIERLIRGSWVQLATLHPESGRIQRFCGQGFAPYTPQHSELPEVRSSLEWYRGWRDHLGFAVIKAGEPDRSVHADRANSAPDNNTIHKPLDASKGMDDGY